MTKAKQKLSLRVDFSVEGVQFPESLIGTLEAALVDSIARTVAEGELTNDEHSIVKLEKVSHFKPVVNVVMDGSCIDRTSTNVEGLVLNIIEDADGGEDDEIYAHNGNVHVYVNTAFTDSYCPEATALWAHQVNALHVVREGEFVEISKEEFFQSTEPLKVRPVFHVPEQGWSLQMPEGKDFFESGYEVVLDSEESVRVVYRFFDEKDAEAAVSVWTEYRQRVIEE